jgi:hypothetical protein
MPKSKFPKTAILIAMTDEQAMEVGRMVAQWAYFEHWMNIYLSALLKLPEAADFKKSIKMTFASRIKLWRELAEKIHSEKKEKQTIDEIIQRTCTLHGMRDKLVHGVRWALSNRIDFHKHSHPEGNLTTQEVSISASRALRLRDEIGELSFELHIFYQRFSLSRVRIAR